MRQAVAGDAPSRSAPLRPEAKADADLFERIGRFLRDHRLSPDPQHYAFAHRVLSEPDGPLAGAVARLTDGGIRLTRADLESLGAAVAPGGREAGTRQDAEAAAAEAESRAARLAADAHQQVAAFVGLARAARDEARGFGRDLAEHTEDLRRAQAPAARAASPAGGADEVIRLAAAMVGRVREAEGRLAEVTAEADSLRVELEEARVTARRDPLTGLCNRRALEEAFDRLDRARAVHVAVCDVDLFKRINDEHGHAVGDRVLRAIGGALAAACGGQMVARHGGEEFAILLTGLSDAQALALVEQGRAAVATRRFRTRDTDAPIRPVTLSAGLTAVAPAETLGQALARADRHLYVAKASGRDCCRTG